jgi:hypothetical protein
MIRTTLVRELRVNPLDHPRGQPHLSAASGLVQVGRRLYIVADDEHHIGILDQDSAAPLRLHRVRAGVLSADRAERKRHKPDLEALALLPPSASWPHGALLALGSGSRPNREQGFIVLLDAHGGLAGAVMWLPLAALYQPLREAFGEVNIEGAFVAGEQLCLLQRAHKGRRVNACVAYGLHAFAAWLREEGPVPALLQVTRYELGEVDGIPLSFTDGAALPQGGWVFSAVAEDTHDSYADGHCRASAIGRVSPGGHLGAVEPLEGAPKVEGICVRDDGTLLLVTDTDDPARPSALLSIP